MSLDFVKFTFFVIIDIQDLGWRIPFNLNCLYELINVSWNHTWLINCSNELQFADAAFVFSREELVMGFISGVRRKWVLAIRLQGKLAVEEILIVDVGHALQLPILVRVLTLDKSDSLVHLKLVQVLVEDSFRRLILQLNSEFQIITSRVFSRTKDFLGALTGYASHFVEASL